MSLDRESAQAEFAIDGISLGLSEGTGVGRSFVTCIVYM